MLYLIGQHMTPLLFSIEADVKTVMLLFRHGH